MSHVAGEQSQVLPVQFEQVNEKPSPWSNQGGRRGEGAVCGPKVVLVAGELGQVRGDTIWWKTDGLRVSPRVLAVFSFSSSGTASPKGSPM